MKRFLSIYLGIALATLLLLMVGCKKYQKGPRLSICSKKARVVAKWEFEINPDNNTVSWRSTFGGSTMYIGDIVELTKDMKVLWNGLDYGTWAFDDDKEEIVINTASGNKFWYIIKLKNNNLWVEYNPSNTSSSWIWHFKRIK